MKHRIVLFLFSLLLVSACTSSNEVNTPGSRLSLTPSSALATSLRDPNAIVTLQATAKLLPSKMLEPTKTIIPTPVIVLATTTPLPSKTLESTKTLTPTPDIVALRTQGFIDPWIVATLGKRIAPPWYRQKVLFSPDGKLLASSYSNKISLWEMGSYKQLSTFQFMNEDYGIERFAFSSDGKLLAAVVSYWDDPKTHLFVWDTTDGEQLKTMDMESAILAKDIENPYRPYRIQVNAIGFVPESKLLAVANGNTIQLVNVLDSGEPVTLKLGKDMCASEISFPSDGRFIYVLMAWWKDHDFPANWKTKYIAQIWDTNSHFLWRTLDFPEIDWADEFMSLHQSYLVRRNPEKGTLELINLENDEKTQLPYRKGWEYLTADNKFVIFMRYFGIYDEQDEGIEFWRTDTWRKVYTLKPEFYKYPGFSGIQLGSFQGEIAISDDNSLLAIVYSGQVFIYDIRLIITTP